MGLEEVVGDILAAGRAKAEQLRKEAESERDRLLDDAMQRSHRLREGRMQEAVRLIAQIRVRELAAAELEVRRARLAMERDLLELAAQGARQKVAALPRAEDEALLSAILAKGTEAGFRLFSARRSEAFLRSGSPLPYAGSISCIGGLVLESPDGTIRMDYTYDTILRETVDRTMREIYGILFAR